MVRKIFWEDPYQTKTDAVITSVKGGAVTVDRTTAFAYPGGQVFDTGTIGGLPILNALYDKKEIYYTLPEGHGLKPGDSAPVEIGWERRYRIMKLHFAAELFLAAMLKRYGKFDLTRADILEDRGILEFAWEGDISAIFPALEEDLKGLVAANHAIISEYEDRENEKRYWEIPGYSKVICGGTHLKTTGEIGTVNLKRYKAGQGKEGIEMILAV
jgi:Ser-tRNA(Ala) deacylase AlaX